MARIHRKFGRSNRAPGHGAEHPGQARASQRKRQRQALKAAALAAEAAKLGITVLELQKRNQLAVNAIAAQQVKQVSYTPPSRSSWQDAYSRW